MTDNDANTKILPLHSKVGDADEGDCGWLWYDGKWRLGRLAFSDDDADEALYIDLLLEEKAEWYEVEALKHLPWLPIPRPPYEGNETPCTHAVTIMDQQATLTFSWNMNESDGKRAVQKVTAYVEAMLRETDAPVSVG